MTEEQIFLEIKNVNHFLIDMKDDRNSNILITPDFFNTATVILTPDNYSFLA